MMYSFLESIIIYHHQVHKTHSPLCLASSTRHQWINQLLHQQMHRPPLLVFLLDHLPCYLMNIIHFTAKTLANKDMQAFNVCCLSLALYQQPMNYNDNSLMTVDILLKRLIILIVIILMEHAMLTCFNCLDSQMSIAQKQGNGKLSLVI